MVRDGEISWRAVKKGDARAAHQIKDMTLRMGREMYMLLKAKTVQAWCKERNEYMIHIVHVYIEITEHNSIGRECAEVGEKGDNSSMKPLLGLGG